MVTLKCVSKMDQGELLMDDLINIAGAEEQDQWHQQQIPELRTGALGLGNSKGQEALECDMIVEEKEVRNARKLAISIKSQFCVTGRDTEVVAVQAGLK